MIWSYYFYKTVQAFFFFPHDFLSFIEINFDFHLVGRGSMRDYFLSRSTTQLPSTEYNFRQHLLHHNTSFIAFSVNELKRHHLERHPQPMKANTPLIQINFHSIFIQIVEQDMVWENARCTARHVTIVRDNIISWACAGRKRKYMGPCQPEKSMIVSLRCL